MRARLGLGLVAAILGISTAVPARAPAALPLAHIQPGAPLTDPTQFPDGTLPYPLHRCTMAFVLADVHKALYVITADHCLFRNGLGIKTYDETGRAFGTVVYRHDSGTDDIALIKIDRSRYGDVSASVRDWGGPTGVATPSTVKQFDQLKFSGFSFILGDIALTRARTGILIRQDAVHYMAETSSSEGDSGAPFIDARTGQAVGIVRDFGLTDNPPVTDDGPTMQRILDLLARAGFHLHLKTAPYSG